MDRWTIVGLDISIGRINQILYELYTEGKLEPEDYSRVNRAYQEINEIEDYIEELYKSVDESEKKFETED